MSNSIDEAYLEAIIEGRPLTWIGTLGAAIERIRYYMNQLCNDFLEAMK